jgi:phenylalanyl-tRNA synthetase beta chain
MKVSLNWAQQFSNVDLKKIGTDELLKKIGAQLGAVEDVEVWGPRYDGIYVVKVVEVNDHPNADRLHICLIDDGGACPNVNRTDEGYVQIVCGAPVIEPGMVVTWITPGTVVPSTLDKDPLRLEVREIRGVPSPGMLATAQELGISNDDSGLLLITSEEVGKDLVKPGTPFKKLYGLDDVVVDCENKMFTHRPDCFGILGVARELAGITGQKFVSPDWYLQTPNFETPANNLSLKMFNDVPTLAPRMVAVVIDDVTIKPSPLWLQAGLTRVGIHTINNIVDVTNFLMQLTGQPMHAFDYDKIAAHSDGEATLGIRLAKANEKLNVLSGKQLTLTKDDIVLATDKEPADLAGLMGGAHTEIDQNTKRVLLTCASFDMYAIRKASMRHGIFTDAGTRYTKGQSPLQNDRALWYALRHMLELSGGKQASKVFDLHGEIKEPATVTVQADFINDRLGSELKAAEIQKLLQNVEFDVAVNGSTIQIRPPFWRTDIEVPEDIVEEVGRLYGYDKLPVELPRRDSKPAARNIRLDVKQQIRQILSSAGANEILSYSFVHGDLLQKSGQDPKQAFTLSNALSPDLQYYRLSLTPSLLDKVYGNIRAGFEELAIYEIGMAHNKLHAEDDEGLPKEFNVVSLVFAASDKLSYQGSAYYQVKYYLQYLADKLGVQLVYETLPAGSEAIVSKPYEQRRSALVKDSQTGNVIGVVGELRSAVRQNLKLPRFTAAFEIDLDELMKLIPSHHAYRPLSRFPSIAEDISFKVPADLLYSKLTDVVENELHKLGAEHGYVTSWKPVDIYQPEDDPATKHFTVRIQLTHPERTLTTAEANKVVEQIAVAAQQTLSAVRL